MCKLRDKHENIIRIIDKADTWTKILAMHQQDIEKYRKEGLVNRVISREIQRATHKLRFLSVIYQEAKQRI